MRNHKRYTGSIPMLPTAFEPDGTLHEAGIAALIDSVHRFDAFAVLGFGSECLQLTIEERIRVAAMAASRRADQGLVVGCTATGEDESCSLIAHAASVGADAVMVAPPREFTRSGSVSAFYERVIGLVGEAALVVQDAPQWASREVGARLVVQLHEEHPSVVRYVKPEAVPYTELMAELGNRSGLGMLAGLGGSNYLDALDLGATGVIPFPEAASALDRVADASGDTRRALFEPLLPLLSFQIQTLEHAVLCSKLLLAERGVAIGPSMRMPAPKFGDRSRDVLINHAVRAGIVGDER